MSPLKFLHAADLHIDSPLQGLERYEGAPVDEMRLASRRAFENLVDLALEARVAFVLLAGDLFDGDWPDFNTGLFFQGQLRRLTCEGIRVAMVQGNHDAQSKVTRALQLPEGCHRFRSKEPDTVVWEDLGVAVHGQSFATVSVQDNLARGYPAARKGLLNVGLLHTSLDGRPGHGGYAPCTKTDLASLGY